MNSKTAVLVTLLGAAALARSVSPLFLNVATAHTFGAPESPAYSSTEDEHPFKWTGDCTVRCDNGQCRAVLRSGIVYSRDMEDARIRATADFEAEASREGTIMSGTVHLVVEF